MPVSWSRAATFLFSPNFNNEYITAKYEFILSLWKFVLKHKNTNDIEVFQQLKQSSMWCLEKKKKMNDLLSKLLSKNLCPDAFHSVLPL